MTYAPPPNPQAIVLDLGSQYSPPTNPAALHFDLADQDSNLGPIYRKPPLAVSAGWQSHQASLKAYDHRTQGHELGKPEDGAGRRYNGNQARVLGLPSYGGGWDLGIPKDRASEPYSADNGRPTDLAAKLIPWLKVPSKDDPAGYGNQAWDVQAPKEQRADQGFNWPQGHNVATPMRASDSILNWQAPPPEEVDLVQSDTLNLQVSPYQPPGAGVVDFELVPPTIAIEVKPPTRSVDAQPDLPSWSLKQALDGRTIHPWDRKPRLNTEIEFPSANEPEAPEGEPPPEPEIKRTYIVMNASSLTEATTGTPLEFQGLSIELDIDSFAWTMSCTILNRASMDQIRPTAEGPAEVIASINGHQWRFVVERYSLNRKFAKEAYTVKGVSRPQLLAAPYAPKRTGRITSQTTATQAMTEQLQFTGFSVSRQTGLTDYVIPAGAWGWDNKTAMEVIAELAAAQGAVVIPDREADTLHIRHRYKLAGPWAYDELPMESVDVIIADTMTISYASQWEPQPEYNAVFVSGITDGVAIEVVRQGTAGDKPAPDIFDDLNVESSQCRERGLASIAAGGNQEIVTIETVLPTSGSPGLIEPAMLVEVRDTIEPANTWRGNVLSVGISCGQPGTGRVTQTVKIERHHY